MNGKRRRKIFDTGATARTAKASCAVASQGYGVMQIVELSGLSYPTVRAAIDRYEEGGLAAIRPATRGKRAGQGEH
jgi:transposase